MKWVRQFGGGSAEGRSKDKSLLGGKGANLAEMASLGLPVPPGFTITTEVCRHVTEHRDEGAETYPAELAGEVDTALAQVEELTKTTFGDAGNPLLVSVRSGAPASMPGMMDTILNLGLNDTTVAALATQSGNARFAWDCYRRFVAMYGEVVLGVVAASESDEPPFDKILDGIKSKHRAVRDQDLKEDALREIVAAFKATIQDVTGKPFPDDVKQQLWGAIGAVFRSWKNPRADVYRKMSGIPASMGTAVNVQAMVFGNLGDDCATGVAFTRNPATGTAELYGEFLTNAQGEDVVAGIRTPEPIAELAKKLPAAHAELVRVAKLLEDHFRDMQDLEFTIQRGQLFMLQTRNGKRTGKAMVKVAVDLVAEGKLTPQEAILRIDPQKLDEVLHPTIDPKSRPTPIAKGLPASPGAAIGRVVFTANAAEEWHSRGEQVLLVRTETSPEDIHGMKAAAGTLTARGGMTCVAPETQVLTDRGLLSAEAAFAQLESGERLRILSVDSKSLRAVWRDVIAAGRKPSQVISVSVSQTGRVDDNVVRLTDDHKTYFLENRKLTKKPIKDVLAAEDFVLAVDQLPSLGETATSAALAYVAGAILSDGYIKVAPTKGSVTFIQKRTEEKIEFIAAVEQAFLEAFEVPFSYVRQRETVATLRGREIRGEVQDRICFRREPAERLAWIRDNLPTWVLTLDETALRFFLAGYVDGDGTLTGSSEDGRTRIQITVSGAKPKNLEGVVLACLRLGILPQVVHNRDAYNIQIAEHVDKILSFTHRVYADAPERAYESKCFSVRGLFADIVDEVNFMGRVREGIKRHLMFGAEKVRRDVLPLCNGEQSRELQAVLDSSLRSYRAKQVGDHEDATVYNFEVDASDELDKNFVVFSSRLTPILVSNSHAAVVARGMGKCCITACTSLRVDAAKKTAVFTGGGKEHKLKEGDTLTLDGSTGEVFIGPAPLVPAQMGTELGTLMQWVDEHRRLRVRTNADTPTDARTARAFGAEGIGLCRTEHMFFQPERILAVREMIVASDEVGRRKALAKILPMQKSDFAELFRVMDGLPVTIRLLDPPLHEFLPHAPHEIEEVASALGKTPAAISAKVAELTEANPMLGHRGCRLAIAYPEIYEIQVQAIGEAAAIVAAEGVKVQPEIMIPLVMNPEELKRLRALCAMSMDKALAGAAIPYTIGTMIELPRACVVADQIAEHADFFSFGTNDLTQTTFGLSRDDAGRFLPTYIDSGVLRVDPFAVLDQEGVGALIELGVRGGRATRPNLKVGICGEHGGEPSSVEFCHRAGFDYVSCSPFRVPIARVAAARAALLGAKP